MLLLLIQINRDMRVILPVSGRGGCSHTDKRAGPRPVSKRVQGGMLEFKTVVRLVLHIVISPGCDSGVFTNNPDLHKLPSFFFLHNSGRYFVLCRKINIPRPCNRGKLLAPPPYTPQRVNVDSLTTQILRYILRLWGPVSVLPHMTWLTHIGV